MVVDDENSVATYMGEVLNFCGIENSVFTDSTMALAAFTSDPDKYDLVITDQTMPSLTGDVLAREILKVRNNTPIILCTGYSDIVDEASSKDMNVSAFLKKPVQTSTLLETIYSTLNS